MSAAAGLPFISVLVPFRNEERYIAACAESLLGQRYPSQRYEIFFVDNNSSDASAEIVRSQPRIRLLQETRPGPYAARNRGLRQAQGQLFAFTDADCLVGPDWLQEIAAGMAGPTVQILMGSNSFGRPSFLLNMIGVYEAEKKRYIFHGHLGEAYHGQCNNMAVRGPLLEELGGFVERQRGADTILVHRCLVRHGSQAIAYRPTMHVQHLEVDSLAVYYRKCAIYRRSRRAYHHLIAVRGLTNGERSAVFRNAVRAGGYSLPEALLLFALLAGGLAWSSVRSRLPERVF